MFREKAIDLIQKNDWLPRLLLSLSDAGKVQWFIRFRDHLAFVLYALWIAGCGLWFYQFLSLEAEPLPGWIHILEEPTEAVIFLLFGSMGVVFAAACALGTVKFIYNMIHDGIHSLFPGQWYVLAKSVVYWGLLVLAFFSMGNIKTVALTVHQQAVHVLDKSREHQEEVDRNIAGFAEFLKRDKQSESSGDETLF